MATCKSARRSRGTRYPEAETQTRQASPTNPTLGNQAPFPYGDAIHLFGSGMDPVQPRERLIAARRKEGLEGMPSRRHLGPPWGWTRSQHTPEGIWVVDLCVVVERTGGVSRATDRTGAHHFPCGGADSPRCATLEHAGQRAVPSSYECSTRFLEQPWYSYRLMYRPEPVRHPTTIRYEYRTYSITIYDQLLYSRRHMSWYKAMRSTERSITAEPQPPFLVRQ